MTTLLLHATRFLAVALSMAPGAGADFAHGQTPAPGGEGPPAITRQPVNKVLNSGQKAVFSVKVSGPGPWQYQWSRDGVALPAAAGATLTLDGVQTNDAGGYSVAVTGPLGATTSRVAVLKVRTPAPGRVLSWGFNEFGHVTEVPADLGEVVGIAAGLYRSASWEQDGTMHTWGNNDYGANDIPPGLSNVTAVAIGWLHNVALTRDGTVASWGNTGGGESTVPAELTDAVAIAADGFHSVALRQDGTVMAWGADFFGDTIVPEGLDGVVSVAAGRAHCVALKQDGTLVAWGENDLGQTDVADLHDVVAIAAGESRTVALTRDGAVIVRGYGSGQPPEGSAGVVSVAVGTYHNLALKEDGTLAAWGLDDFGQSTIPAGVSDVLAVAVGERHSVVLVRLSPPPSCVPHRARAMARIGGGSVVGITITDGGCGYHRAPWVLLHGGGGRGAQAVAEMTDGRVTAIRVVRPGRGYQTAPGVLITAPRIWTDPRNRAKMEW